MKAKVTVRAKGARVNSVFLVQLRKRVATDFRGSTRMKQQLREEWWGHGIALVLVREQHCRENLVEWATGISTEGAQEMQKGSAQYSVSGIQFGRGDARSCVDGWVFLLVCGMVTAQQPGKPIAIQQPPLVLTPPLPPAPNIFLTCGHVWDGKSEKILGKSYISVRGRKDRRRSIRKSRAGCRACFRRS